MREGKVSLNVLKRSVLKQIKSGSATALPGADIGTDFGICNNEACYAAISERSDGVFLDSYGNMFLSTSHIGVAEREWEVAGAFYRCANDLYTACGYGMVYDFSVRVNVMMPAEGVYSEEAVLRSIMCAADSTAKKMEIVINGGHTTVSSCVSKPVLALEMTGVLKPKEGLLLQMQNMPAKKRSKFLRDYGKAIPGQDLVITKWIGLEGTAYLTLQNEGTLAGHYRREFLHVPEGFTDYLMIKEDAAVAGKHGVTAMHNLSEGGVLGGLWEFAERSGVGLEVDMKQIPIRQETVEICEFCGKNPYQLLSGGSLLLAADNGTELVQRLGEQGISAAIIGRTTAGNDRIICNDGETRYLDLPQKDEIYQ